MHEKQILEQIEAGKLVAILRGDYGALVEDLVAVLADAGITAVEVTLNSPGALASIAQLAQRFGGQLAVGAGTVLRTTEVEQAAAAGARFIVSPNRDVRVIEMTKRLGLVSLPGCFTPSEIVEALDAGADALKIFPANTLGPGYVKALRGPLPHLRFVPTGGVTPETAREYLAVGAWALGVGSELVSADVKAEGGLARLQTRAAAFVAAVKGARA